MTKEEAKQILELLLDKKDKTPSEVLQIKKALQFLMGNPLARPE